MPTPSVLDIQEILQQILSFLDQKSLCTNARLVCKKWLAASSLTAHRVVMIQTYSSKPNNVTSLLKIFPYAGGLLWVENDSAAAWPQLVATLKYIHEEWTRISQVGGASISEDNIRDAMLAPLRDLGLVGDLQPVLHLAQVLPFLSHLTNLHLSLSRSHDLNLAEVLTACPNLTHLAITGRFASIHISQSPESHSGSFKIPQLPSSLRLKSLYLGNVQILQPYLERVKTLAAPCLRELRLVHLRLEMVLVFVDTIRTIAFDAYLFGLDIRLQFFHFSLDGVGTTKEQFEEFQSQFGQHSITAGWGLNVDTANMLLPHVVQVPNVVTTLELYRGKGASEVEVESLSKFLWDSPSLLHCGPSGLCALCMRWTSISATLPPRPCRRLKNLFRFGCVET